MLEIAEREAVESSVAGRRFACRFLNGRVCDDHAGQGRFTRRGKRSLGWCSPFAVDLALRRQVASRTEGAGCPIRVSHFYVTAASRS